MAGAGVCGDPVSDTSCNGSPTSCGAGLQIWDLTGNGTSSSGSNSCCTAVAPRPGSCALCNSTTTVNETRLCCSNCKQLVGVTTGGDGFCHAGDLLKDSSALGATSQFAMETTDFNIPLTSPELQTWNNATHSLEERANSCIASQTCFYLRNRFSDKCVQVPSASSQQALALNQWPCDQTDAVLWTFETRTGGYFVFRSVPSQKCLDNDARTSPGPVIQYTCQGGNANQEWLLIDLTGKYEYQFKSRSSGLCLDLANLGNGNGNPFVAYHCHAANDQRVRGQTFSVTRPAGYTPRCVSSCSHVTTQCASVCGGSQVAECTTASNGALSYTCTCCR
ncbi:ricin B lectin domain-containing protein [Powellomyces hirtus]|nr:ricin B lectin domain-containing protein [Powellomyces hirtus]